MPSLNLHLTQTGGFFTRINQDLTEGIGKALDELAEVGEERVHAILDTNLMNPTGFYDSQVTHYRPTPDTAVIADSGVIYGPWLEGVGSRNAPVTSFAGYHSFSDAALDLEDMAEQVMDKHIQNTEAFQR